MQDAERALLIVVPKTGLDACRSLQRAFTEDSTVQVILDRRRTDRRVRTDSHEPERRRHDRRRSADGTTALRAARWIAVPRAAGNIDLGDPDARAILFLCCTQHVVPCQGCQNTYRLGWISRGASGTFPCPRCGNDLTPIVAAHAESCPYWAHRRTGAARPEPDAPAPHAATG